MREGWRAGSARPGGRRVRDERERRRPLGRRRRGDDRGRSVDRVARQQPDERLAVRRYGLSSDAEHALRG